MKLLIIEDNASLRRSLRTHLGHQFVVQTAAAGEEGVHLAETETFDLIVLDLKLPDMDGRAVCSAIRSRKIKTPILILTATDTIHSKVELLNMGADDYLTKPFHAEELQARLEALLRRPTAEFSSNVLSVGDLVIDPARRYAERGGVKITLRRKEFDILEYLVRNHGKVVTRSMILNHVWEPSKDNWSNTVDVHIKHLRDKVDQPFERPLIKTAYGIGYKLDA